MIKKLRLRFIFVALFSVAIVLTAAISAMNIYNFAEIKKTANNNLTSIIDAGFDTHHESEPPEGLPPQPENPDENLNNFRHEQYFLVSFDSNGEIVQSDFNHIFKYNEENGITVAKEIYKTNGSTGLYDILRFKKVIKDDVTYLAAIDLKLNYDDANFFLISSSIISTGSFLIFAALIVVASFIVFKPAEESYKKQKQFITNASHELKTPLTIISTDLELIEMDSGKSEWTDSIKDQVARLTNMTNQLVFLSKMEENDIKHITMSEFSLSELLIQTIDTFSPSFAKANLILDSSIEKNISYKGNLNFIGELINIFLENALKYAKEDGKVFVSLSKDKNKISLMFSNDVKDGSKIDVSQLFDRFYRGESQKRGSGIGLSIAKEIVRIHKGDIKASVEDNKIIFELTL